jgi:hypothetical protein
MPGVPTTTPPGLPVSLHGHAFGSMGAPTSVMVEVRGPDRRLVDRRMLQVNAPPVPMRLSGPGPHAVRATLGSGSVLYEDVDYDGVTAPPPVRFLLYDQSPHESLQRAAIVHRLGDVRVGHLASPRYLSAWVQLWRRNTTGWSPAEPRLDLAGCSWDDDAVRLTLNLGRHQYVLQAGAPGVAPLLTALPGMGATEVVIRPIAEPDRHPMEVAVTPASAVAATLLGYFGGGAVTAVDAMIATNPLLERLVEGQDLYDAGPARHPSPASLAESVLRRKVNDPNTAALGGYHLLRTGELRRLHSWPANLADWMNWMSDGPVIRGWQLLRGATARPGETPRQRFLQAAGRGLPIFSDGLRLLIDGLKVVGRGRHDDSEVAAAITRMGDYAAVTDWSHTILTFAGDDPGSPTPRPIPTARSGEAGTLMLHSVTLDDLIARGLLRPGTLLRTSPRLTRRVKATSAYTAQVTADGLICSGPHRFAEPNQALIATQPDITDGWYAWSTPDGETLDDLRRRARQWPPISET